MRLLIPTSVIFVIGFWIIQAIYAQSSTSILAPGDILTVTCSGTHLNAPVRVDTKTYRFNANGCVGATPTPIPVATSTPTSTPVATATPSSTPIPTPPPSSGLHVVGSQITNSSGQPVQLHGVNRSGFEYACVEGWGFSDGPVDTSQITIMKSWNIDVVRMTLNESCWLGYGGVPAAYSGTNYQNAMANYASLFTSNGIPVIINLHWSSPSTFPSKGQEPMADRDHSNAFWTSVANRFKDNPNVLFEPYNEPHDISWTCWRDGGCTVQGSQSGEPSFVAAGMQEMVAAIRNTGATNIIVVTGNNWGSDVSGWHQYKPTDPLNQMVAGWHSYGDGLSCQNLSCWNTVLVGVLNEPNPILATEIGELDCAHGYIDQVMNFLDGYGQGYMAWTWGPFSCSGDPALLTNWNGTPTQTYGQGFKDHLLGR